MHTVTDKSFETDNNDILIECSKDDLNKTLEILKQHLPQEIQQHNLIYNYLYHYERLNQYPNRKNVYSDRWNQRFYRHRNGKLENCTMLVVTGEKDYIIMAFSLEPLFKLELKECLLKTARIDWQNNSMNITCNESLFKDVYEMASQKCSDWFYPPLEHILYISKEKVMEFDAEPNVDSLPTDLYLASLDAEKHSKYINEHWYYKDDNSLNLIKQSINWNGGLGIFRKNAKTNPPISWIATNAFFTPGFLYTESSERRKGYAKFIMKAELQRLVRLHNIDIYSFVSVENEPSLKLHMDIGFEVVNKIIWFEK